VTPSILAAVAVAGGLGAASRFGLDGVLRSRFRGALPVATILINLSGSFVLGLLTGMAAVALLPDAARAVAGTGFLGGYTTFSAASVETVRLVGARRPVLAAVNGVVVPLAAVLLAAAGLLLGGALNPAR
jgi:fluoride exporter